MEGSKEMGVGRNYVGHSLSLLYVCGVGDNVCSCGEVHMCANAHSQIYVSVKGKS